MNLQKLRCQCGLSQSQLAEKSNVNIRTLQAYERNAKNIDGAKLNTLIDLASALNCKVSDILEDKDLKEKCKEANL